VIPYDSVYPSRGESGKKVNGLIEHLQTVGRGLRILYVKEISTTNAKTPGPSGPFLNHLEFAEDCFFIIVHPSPRWSGGKMYIRNKREKQVLTWDFE
jgi:hypothetical protein